MKNNYVTKTGSRGLALSGKTLLHAVNNVWFDVKSHPLEGSNASAQGIFEGNIFDNVQNVVAGYAGKLFGFPDANTNKQCSTALGRSCQVNPFQGTTTTASSLTSKKDASFFNELESLAVASTKTASETATRIPRVAGIGKLSALAGRSASVKFKE